MSHREEPRSGRGCFGAVVVLPFLALGGMFALIALTGSPSESPLAAPPPSRPSAQWWTEPFETGTSLSTVTETVVMEGAVREVRAARLATQTRVAVSTVTETVRVSSTRPAAVGRNEPPVVPGEEEPAPPSSSDTAPPPVSSSSSVSTVEPAPPVLEPPATTAPPTSTPRAEDPVPPVVTPAPTSPVEPPCERVEPPSEGDSAGEPDLSVEAAVEVPLASPAEVLSTSAAPLAGA